MYTYIDENWKNNTRSKLGIRKNSSFQTKQTHPWTHVFKTRGNFFRRGLYLMYIVGVKTGLKTVLS